ncbi:MAG: pyridoxamine 5'-phosphate oxidase [Acidobacteriota bacterium]
MRYQYTRGGLARADLSPDPFILFQQWLKDALDSPAKEPSAMSLATVDADGRPSLRTVLLKGFDARGFRFFTSYGSRKGSELAANPHGSLLFFWAELERQVRVEGTVERIAREESEEYFHSRPVGSQISAASSPQSRVVANRAELESRQREVEDRFAGQQVALPEDWGGYRLWPQNLEFWQGRPNRLHDRFRYRRTPDDEWVIERLAP